MEREDELLSIPEAAARTNVQERTLREAVRKKYIKAQRIGGRWAVTLRAVNEWKSSSHYYGKYKPRE